MEKILQIIGISIGIMMVGFLSYSIYEKQRIEVVDPSAIEVGYPLDFYDKYKETYEQPLNENERKLLPTYQKELKKMKMDAYVDGYRDFVVFREKKGPNYFSTSLFKTNGKEDENAQKRVYQDMYENGYKDGERDLHRLPGLD